MSYNTKALNPAHRVKTGDFRDAFAREANKRRYEGLMHQGSFTNHHSRDVQPREKKKRFSFIPRFGDTRTDEERPRNKLKQQSHENSSLRIHRMRIPIAWSRVPRGGEQETLFLATDDRATPGISYPKDRTLHWIHMQHYEGIEFDTFKTKGLDAVNIPVHAKTMIKDWLSDIHASEAQSIFGGKSLDSCVGKQRITSLSGQSLVCAFFAVPYVLLSENCQYVVNKGENVDFHPIRALVQSAYRTDSLFTREKSQAVRKVLELRGNSLIYVPQLWGLIIGDYYLVTCASTQLHTHPSSSIVPLPLKEFPSVLRLIQGESIFYVNLVECPTWLDFLARIHHIYSRFLNRHIDSEKCVFLLGETNACQGQHRVLHAGSWHDVSKIAGESGVCIDITVVLNNKHMPNSPSELDYEQEGYFLEPKSDERTWIRVSKRFLDMATLDAFNLPWEEDKNDPSYFIIKTYVDTDFTEVLFEHTRRARRLRGESAVHELSDDGAEGRSFVDEAGDVDRSGWHWPGCIEKDPANQLRGMGGDMFWEPTSLSLHDMTGEDGEYESDKSSTHGPTGDSIKLSGHPTDDPTEAAVPPYLTWPIASEISALTHNQGQKTITRVPESGRMRDVKQAITPRLLVKYLYSELQKEEAFARLPRAKRSDLDGLKAARFARVPAEESSTILIPYPETDICDSLCELVDHFLPNEMHCPLKEKIYGALCNIVKKCLNMSPAKKFASISLLEDFFAMSSELLHTSKGIRAGIQTDTSRLPLLKAHMDCFMELCRAISHFSAGMAGELFQIMHLETQAEVERAVDTLDQTLASEPSIIGAPAVENPVNRNDESPVAVSTVSRSTTEDAEISPYIPHQPGSTTGNEEGDTSSPANSKSGSTASLSDASNALDARETRPRWRYSSGSDTESDRSAESQVAYSTTVLQMFERANDLLRQSKYAVVCTLIKTNPLEFDDYLAVGPSRIASSILQHITMGLSDMKDAGSFHLEDIYREYSSQLRIKVRDQPSRALLDELDLLEEELDSILMILEKQKWVLDRFPSFAEDKTSNPKRGSRDVIQHCLRDLNYKTDLYHEISSSIEKLRRKVVRQVDLQQDNNSKAILVFTTVTIIFLPLSFITSYLGMNTNDIRNMDMNQWLFWAISVPFTLLVVGVCVVIADQGARIRDAVVQSLYRHRAERTRTRAGRS